ncbi:MAG: class I SAM-dependent methyltransferase [Candidatus Cloacimonadales bacterium]|nr:class I SAM-dependent methyltransferase [Candidatus Cloacimonadales bacterium]
MEKIKETYKLQLAKFKAQKKNQRRLWNISEKCAELLFMLIQAKRPKRILEIGTSNGYSTFWLSLAAESCGAVIDTIEIDESRFKLAKENLKELSNIVQHVGKAEFIIPELNNKYDFVFIDAGKIDYIIYLKLLLEKLKNNALIVADNVISHEDTVKEYLDFINSDLRFVSMTLPLEAGLEISVFRRKV